MDWMSFLSVCKSNPRVNCVLDCALRSGLTSCAEDDDEYDIENEVVAVAGVVVEEVGSKSTIAEEFWRFNPSPRPSSLPKTSPPNPSI